MSQGPLVTLLGSIKESQSLSNMVMVCLLIDLLYFSDAHHFNFCIPNFVFGVKSQLYVNKNPGYSPGLQELAMPVKYIVYFEVKFVF